MTELRHRGLRMAVAVGATALVLVLANAVSDNLLPRVPDQPNTPSDLGTQIESSFEKSATTKARAPSPSPEPEPDCDRARPWSESCEGVWSRLVVEEAGYSVFGEGSSAWEVATTDFGFYLWARPSDEVPRRFRKREGYDAHFAYEQGVVHSDGIRLVWKTEDLWVWIQGFGITDDTTQVVENLLAASLRTPYPPPLPEPEEP